VTLALAHLEISLNHFDLAAGCLLQLPAHVRAQPAILHVLVQMLTRTKDSDAMAKEVRAAVAFWDKNGEQNLEKVLRIAVAAAEALQLRELAAECQKLFLEKVDGTDTGMLCGLVRSLSCFDVPQALQYSRRLKTPSHAHLDPEELEVAVLPRLFNRQKKETEAEGAEVQKRKQKKKRKIRYPKGFDPANPGPPPDPERWLPKYERQEYIKKMRKQKPLARGPQGAAPEDDMAFSRYKGPSTAQTDVSKDGGSRQQKKGKRRR